MTSALVRREIRFGWARPIGFFMPWIVTTLAPVVLFILTFIVMQSGGGWFTPFDFAFLGVLGALIIGREWEFRRCEATAPYREPPTAAVLVFGLVIWTVANILGNSLLIT